VVFLLDGFLVLWIGDGFFGRIGFELDGISSEED